MCSDTISAIFFLMLTLILPEKWLIHKNFTLLTQISRLLVWAPKLVKTYTISDEMGYCMSSKQFKTTNSNIPRLKLFRLFQTISDKNYEKNCYLDNFFVSAPFPPLTMLRVNEQILRQAVIVWKHCKGGQMGFLNRLLKIPIIFRHWLQFCIVIVTSNYRLLRHC